MSRVLALRQRHVLPYDLEQLLGPDGLDEQPVGPRLAGLAEGAAMADDDQRNASGVGIALEALAQRQLALLAGPYLLDDQTGRIASREIERAVAWVTLGERDVRLTQERGAEIGDRMPFGNDHDRVLVPSRHDAGRRLRPRPLPLP